MIKHHETPPNKSPKASPIDRSGPPLALAVPLSRFTPRVRGGPVFTSFDATNQLSTLDRSAYDR
jgi:hypothetical protein